MNNGLVFGADFGVYVEWESLYKCSSGSRYIEGGV